MRIWKLSVTQWRSRGIAAVWRLLVLAALAWVSAPALAHEGLRLGGFGTLGYVSDNRSDIAPSRDVRYRPADSFATGSTWKMDSRLGLQAEYGIGADMDLVAQWVVRDEDKSDFDSSLELAYVTFRPNGDTDLRIGRVNYDTFLMSDHRNVGYAYLWVRPPSEFYAWIPVYSVDGADATYVVEQGDVRWRFKAQLGRARGHTLPIGDGFDSNGHDLLGFSVSRKSPLWHWKLAYSQFRFPDDPQAFQPLHDGLDLVAAAGIPSISGEAADLRRHLGFKNARVSYTTIGVAYDDGAIVAQAELGKTTSTSDVVPHGRMGYASIGHRFGDWTPFVTVARSRPENDIRQAVNDWGGFNVLRDRALFVVSSTRIEQDTLSLGMRWDVAAQAAVKLQWDRTRIKPSGYGLWWRDFPVNDVSSRINQLTATLDFTF